MFGLGISEILMILGLALIFIGPERIPDLARALAKGFTEFRRSFDEVKSSIEQDLRAVNSDNLLRQAKAAPFESLKQSLLEPGEDKLLPPAAIPPEPVAAPVATSAPDAVPFLPQTNDDPAALRAQLKAELKAELLAELRAELTKPRQGENADEH